VLLVLGAFGVLIGAFLENECRIRDQQIEKAQSKKKNSAKSSKNKKSKR
jgi:hypothetical protein